MAKRATPNFTGFPKETFRFLKTLTKNNNREWFAEHKAAYEAGYLEPALAFIRAMRDPLDKVAPLLAAEPKKSGGSLMRIYKDTRFSKDKTPYKTNIGIHFRHAAGKDIHAPGVYLHIACGECFVGAGIWRAASAPLLSIRNYMIEHPDEWRKVHRNRTFRANFDLYDDRLRSAPRGFSKDHPLIEDLRLKSFIGMKSLSQTQITDPEIVLKLSKTIRAARPLMGFLCNALNQPY